MDMLIYDPASAFVSEDTNETLNTQRFINVTGM